MKNRFIVIGGLLNLVTLVIGLAIGFIFGTSYSGRVYAQANQKIEEITPGVTTGSFAAALILAHEINADSVVVQGFDILKLHQNTLNYLSRQPLANQVEIQRIIDESKAEKVYHMKAPQAPVQQKPKEEKKP